MKLQPKIKADPQATLQDYIRMQKESGIGASLHHDHIGINAFGNVVNTKPSELHANKGTEPEVMDNDAAIIRNLREEIKQLHADIAFSHQEAKLSATYKGKNKQEDTEPYIPGADEDNRNNATVAAMKTEDANINITMKDQSSMPTLQQILDHNEKLKYEQSELQLPIKAVPSFVKR